MDAPEEDGIEQSGLKHLKKWKKKNNKEEEKSQESDGSEQERELEREERALEREERALEREERELERQERALEREERQSWQYDSPDRRIELHERIIVMVPVSAANGRMAADMCNAHPPQAATGQAVAAPKPRPAQAALEAQKMPTREGQQR